MKRTFAIGIGVCAAVFLLVRADATNAAAKVYFAQEKETLATTLYPVYEMGLKGQDLKEFKPGGSSLNAPEGIAIAPAGNKIAMASPAGIYELLIMNANGTGKTYLNDAGLGADHMVSWAPGSTEMAFTRESYELNEFIGKIYLVGTNGKNTSLVLIDNPKLKHAYNPSYAPGGNRLVFEGVNLNGIHNIYTVKTDGTRMKKLTKCTKGCLEPRFSPNGKRIAFIKRYKKQYHLYTMKKDGSSKKQLTSNAKARTPYYSPNGKKIFYSFKKKGEVDFEIYSLRLRDKNKKRLTDNGVDDLRPTVGELN
ncbi:MAG: DUF5050 domain-containing protein [Candidatus Kerfeldbacteria bacterium]